MSDPITIMLVDDHKMIRMGLSAYFATLPDIQVVAEAESGKMALELIEKHVPDVVLMDLNMPEMDGVWLGSELGTADRLGALLDNLLGISLGLTLGMLLG